MTLEQFFDSMTKTRRVCEVCSSYLYFNSNDGAHYCPECDFVCVAQYADLEMED